MDSPGLMDFQDELAFLAQIIDEADILLFVVDGKQGYGRKEQEIHEMICRAGKFDHTILVVNKLDSKVYTADRHLMLAERYALGYKDIQGVSAIQQEGIDILEDLIQTYLHTLKIDQGAKKPSGDDAERLHLAIVGRPNAGKSTLLNKLV